MRLLSLAAALAAMAGCTTGPSDLNALHRRAAKHPRPIDIAIRKAAAEAQKACGGGAVIMVVEGDQADYGWDASHYQCAD